MPRRRALVQATGALALVLLLLVPGLLRGHAHAQRDVQPSCAACVLANHGHVAEPAGTGPPAPVLATLVARIDEPVVPDAPVATRLVARGPPARLRTIA